MQNAASKEDQLEEQRKLEISTAKTKLRHIADRKGLAHVIGAASTYHEINKDDFEEIRNQFRIALSTGDLKSHTYQDFIDCLQPENQLERIKHRRSVAVSAKRDFVVVKGTVGQAEHLEENLNKLERNENVGFRALRYSVAENSGTV